MKKQILFFLIFILSAAAVNSQTWRKLSQDGMPTGSDCSFINDNTGWYSGYGMSVYKTTDGGVTWTQQYGTEGSSGTLYSVCFVDENTGYAGGTAAALIKTTDGGATWTPLTIPDVTNNIKAIKFNDAQTGWVLASSSSSAAVYKTNDGGASWTQVLTHTAEMYALEFYGTHGVAIGKNFDALFYTTDGDTWTKGTVSGLTYPSYTRSDVRAAYMVNENLIYACGWGSTVGAQPSILLKSTDGGANWTYLGQTEENKVFCNLNGVYFKDELNGIAVGGSVYPGSIVVRTSDGGNTWGPISVPFGFTLNEVYGNGNYLFVVGSTGNIISSTDFGDTWTLLNTVSPHTLYSIQTHDGKTVYAGGMNGLFLKSTDSGKTWKNNFLYVNGVSTNIYSMFFLSTEQGYVGQAYKMVCKTTDSGANWVSVISDTSANSFTNYGIYFKDENTGFVVGTFGSSVDIIYRTTDGGASWSSTINQAGENLNGITFSSALNGVAVGDDSKILHTSDGGDTWQIASLTDVTSELDINTVAFTGELTGFAGGDNILLQTNDGGNTWTTVTGFPTTASVSSIAFKDASNGYLVAEKLIYATTDGGTTWNDVSDTITTENTTLKNVCIDENGYAWICGNSGIIITNAPESSVSVADEGKPLSFYLIQNYPNPFNPSTTITYSLESRDYVSIKIFDVTGREVEVLYNGEAEAGLHTIKYDAGKLASGTYFCSMQSGNKTKTLKMSLIK